jgi:hypothetical protein
MENELPLGSVNLAESLSLAPRESYWLSLYISLSLFSISLYLLAVSLSLFLYLSVSQPFSLCGTLLVRKNICGTLLVNQKHFAEPLLCKKSIKLCLYSCFSIVK